MNTKITFNKDNIKRILEYLLETINYSNKLLLLADFLDSELSKKYKELDNKWYIYCLNSLDNDFFLSLNSVFDSRWAHKKMIFWIVFCEKVGDRSFY